MAMLAVTATFTLLTLVADLHSLDVDESCWKNVFPIIEEIGFDYLYVSLPNISCTPKPQQYSWQLQKENLQWQDICIPSALSCLQQGLTQKTNYRVRLMPIFSNSAHRVPVGVANITTCQEIIDDPLISNVQVFSRSLGKFFLRWEAYSPCPTSIGYSINIKYEGIVYGYNIMSTTNVTTYRPCKCWPGFICTTLSGDLKEDRIYYIDIQGSYKRGRTITTKISQITARTGQSAPSAPPNLKATNVTATSIAIQFDHPCLPNGIIEGYVLSLERLSSYLADKPPISRPIRQEHYYPIENFNCTYSYQFTNLWPSSVYRVRVYFKNEFTGAESEFNVDTEPQQPHFTANITLVPGSITNSTAIIQLPPAVHNVTIHSSYFLLVTQLVGTPEQLPPQPVLNLPITLQLLVRDNSTTWIAAEVKLADEVMNFTIGSNESTKGQFGSGYINLPLRPGSEYVVSLTAVNVLGKVVKHQTIEMEEKIIIADFETTTNIPLGEPTSQNSGVQASSAQEDDDILAPEIWLVFLLLLPLIPLVGYWLILRHRRKKRESALSKFRMSSINILESDDSPVLSLNQLQAQLDLLEVQRKSLLPPGEDHSRRMNLAEFEDYVMTGLETGELKRQHELFPQGCIFPCEYGQLPANKPKNRYGNLVAYDDTRVVLEKLPGDPYSDYINANYIDGYNAPKMYIATQGPKSNTVNDFWRMVWQEKIHIICMLTRVWEKDKVKSEQYWPDLGKQVTYRQVSVMTLSNQVFADFTFRRLAVSCNGAKREVQHMHFTSWPDHGVPLYAQSVALYLKQLLQAPRGDGPILVHCSAGVGRTGTIILADINLRMAAAESAVDVLHYLQSIRKQRPNLVDNVEQYRLVHMVLLECLIEEETALPCDGDFRARLESLRGEGDLERQYQRLMKRCSRDQALVEYLEFGPGVLCKKRSNRSSLSAVSVSGFRNKNQFVTSQVPSTQSVRDFWHLVMAKNISVILILNEVNPDEVNYNVWPTTDSTLTPEVGMEVNLQRVTEGENLQHTLEFTLGTTVTTVELLRLKGWPRNKEVPDSAASLLKLWEDAERLYKGRGHMLVACSDGVTASGLFVALSFLVEKMKLEQVCDVPHAIRTVRQNRNKFITSKVQFDFLYEAAAVFLESFQTYANFQ